MLRQPAQRSRFLLFVVVSLSLNLTIYYLIIISLENKVQATQSVKQVTKLDTTGTDKLSATNKCLTRALENLKKNDIIENLRCDNKQKHTATCSTPSGLRRKPLKAPKDISFIEKE